MSIDRVDRDQISLDRGSEVRPGAASDGKDRNPGLPTGEDSVSLSATVKEIDRLLQVAKIGRAERIDQIRTQIESGTYAVSGEAVAHKLINAHMR